MTAGFILIFTACSIAVPGLTIPMQCGTVEMIEEQGNVFMCELGVMAAKVALADESTIVNYECKER